jgi:hypothetical protein
MEPSGCLKYLVLMFGSSLVSALIIEALEIERDDRFGGFVKGFVILVTFTVILYGAHLWEQRKKDQ